MDRSRTMQEEEVEIYIGKQDVDCYNHVQALALMRVKTQHPHLQHVDADFLSKLRLMTLQHSPTDPVLRLQLGKNSPVLVFRFGME